ncbi:hypothetical protein QUA71_26110 [Microcoleus sp. MON1_C5]|uniref:hypothetical protein n=1 Tax=Microcoleus sp. MON1_C5 TaxID=2818828 RepID=UPI002FD52C8D
MTHQSAPGNPRSQFLMYSWDKPLALQWYRESLFDGIDHNEAFLSLWMVKEKKWLQYYQASILLPEQCDSLYGVPERTTDRLIRYFGNELKGDGMTLCPETFAVEAEETLGLCWMGKPSTNFLLPPRAVLKLACFMPATQNVVLALSIIGQAADAEYAPLSPEIRISQHSRSVKERLVHNKDKAGMKQQAREQGIYLYAKHFGDLDSAITWKRLLTHYERGGQFPPTRLELNDLILEF